jgi:hypothetical protein
MFIENGEYTPRIYAVTKKEMKNTLDEYFNKGMKKRLQHQEKQRFNDKRVQRVS